MTDSAPLRETNIPGFPVYRGKVRDVYDLGAHLLVVATDRLSAFDVVFEDAIPMKGAVLTQLSRWWFEKTGHIIANHLLSTEVSDYPAALHRFRDQLVDRSMLVKKAVALPAEFVVRGYLDGSAFTSYQAEGKVCGVELLAGLRRRACFGAPIFTPTTKAHAGHDLPISFSQLSAHIGADYATAARDFATALYAFAHNKVYECGLILSDTKFEFGADDQGRLMLIDEALTPDSSRYWLKETYSPDSQDPTSLDKQFVRDYVEGIGWQKDPPAPRLPAEVISKTTERYLRAFEMITGQALT